MDVLDRNLNKENDSTSSKRPIKRFKTESILGGREAMLILKLNLMFYIIATSFISDAALLSCTKTEHVKGELSPSYVMSTVFEIKCHVTLH